VREHKLHAGATEQLMQPGPRRADLHDRVEGPVRGQQLEQSLWRLTFTRVGPATRSPILLMMTTTTYLV
jgi:hypothetical protein